MVVTFVTPQLEKIPRLTASPPPFLQNSPYPLAIFLSLPFLRLLVRSIPPPLKKGEGGVELWCQRANVPKACQLFNLMCQHWHGEANFWTWHVNVPKRVPIFQLFFKGISKFLNFPFMLNICIANFRNIWAILSRNKEFKFLGKNLINLKPLTSFSMEHVELTDQLFG